MLKIIFTGNLTADPELKTVDTANGPQIVCNFTVAVNRIYKNQRTADYYRVSCWNKQAENAERFLHKGSKVGVIASMITARGYTNRNGEIAASMEVPADEIEYLSARSDGPRQEPEQQAAQPEQTMPPTDKDGFMSIPDDIDEDLPFN